MLKTKKLNKTYKKKTKKKHQVPENVRKPLLDISLHKNSWKVWKKYQKNEVIMDRPTDRPTDRPKEWTIESRVRD